MFCGGFAQGGGLVEEDDRAERAFGEFEERGVAGFGARAEVGGIFPGGFFVAAGLVGRRDGPFGEREQSGADDGSDRALRARVEFADGFDGVAEEFDADGALAIRARRRR